MKQSYCLSLILCQNYTVKKHSFFPTVSQKLQANQPFANSLHTIYRMCEEEIERPRVGELLESFQNGVESQPSATGAALQTWHLAWVTVCLPSPLGYKPIWRKNTLHSTFGAKNRSVDERAHLEKSRTEISRNGSKFGNFSSVHCATLGLALGHL